VPKVTLKLQQATVHPDHLLRVCRRMVAAVSDPRSQAAVLFPVGADAALVYVKGGLQALLLAPGAILVGLALWSSTYRLGDLAHIS
jgi:hypothetical protein